MSELAADLSVLPVESLDVLPAGALEALEAGHGMTEIAASSAPFCNFASCTFCFEG